ncbi:hypothetical_protein [Candidozyma auris]|uniref:hypothetical_protein n=1 Tax=Candidozyma auris TaxID=498019 RepID=UPI0012552FD3|nr:hypothetical_protein [[Candida] auris]QEO22573.1 hypothetical_protein [[Candida] auris]
MSKVEDLIIAERNLENISSGSSGGTVPQQNHIAPHNSRRSSWQHIFFIVMFFVFTTCNTMYFVGPVCHLSPMFSKFYIEKTSNDSWSNATSTIMSSFEYFYPGSMDELRKLSSNKTTRDGLSYRFYFAHMCTNTSCLPGDSFHLGVTPNILALNLVGSGEVNKKFVQQWTQMYQEALDKAVAVIRRLEQNGTDHDTKVAQLVKSLQSEIYYDGLGPSIITYVLLSLTIIPFVITLVLNSVKAAVICTLVTPTLILVTAILAIIDLPMPYIPAVFEANGIHILRGGIVYCYAGQVLVAIVYTFSGWLLATSLEEP